ncbi:hypothetical protein EO97_04920 [Methanosarcina sp. 2.H.T.1A.15]|nr:hypothetical protein EO97_04920 [Methanosarcina sp. 2.H.T.1A.15]
MCIRDRSHTVSVIDTTTNTVIDTVTVGIYPTGVAIGPSVDSNITNQSAKATSNATEGTEVKETNLSSSEEKNAVELNNSNNNIFESDNGNRSGENESSKNNSTPGFGLLGSLTCLYGRWKLKKK